MDITQFNENLATVFTDANKGITKRLSVIAFGDTLHLTVRSKKEGHINCVNASVFTLKPASKPHCIELSEVWVGYDQEGSRWSDSMGGKIIDCTGLKAYSAIELIVSEINARVKEVA